MPIQGSYSTHSGPPGAHYPNTTPAASMSASSLPGGPMRPRPTGSPPTVAPGTEICGEPDSPATHVREMREVRQASRVAGGVATSGAGPGADGTTSTVLLPSSALTSRVMSARLDAAASHSWGVMREAMSNRSLIPGPKLGAWAVTHAPCSRQISPAWHTRNTSSQEVSAPSPAADSAVLPMAMWVSPSTTTSVPAAAPAPDDAPIRWPSSLPLRASRN
mmetsp:Transcript_36916/g.93161  ORF Transcript_36916/g.93161 Transcript_36916/m.93161 type:complete len:219 (+) Transcript_36916:172-828(+)